MFMYLIVFLLKISFSFAVMNIQDHSIKVYSGIKWRQNLHNTNLTMLNLHSQDYCSEKFYNNLPKSDILFLDQDLLSTCENKNFYNVFITNYLNTLEYFGNKTQYLLIKTAYKEYFPVMFIKLPNIDFTNKLINNKPVHIDILQFPNPNDYKIVQNNFVQNKLIQNVSFQTDTNIWFDLIEDIYFKIFIGLCQILCSISALMGLMKIKKIIGTEAISYKLLILIPLIICSITNIIAFYDLLGIYGIYHNIFARVIFTIGLPIIIFSILTLIFLWLDTFTTIRLSLNFKPRVPFLVRHPCSRYVMLFLCILLLIIDISTAILENSGFTDANFALLPSSFAVLLLIIVLVINTMLSFRLRKLKNEETNISTFNFIFSKIYPYRTMTKTTEEGTRNTTPSNTTQTTNSRTPNNSDSHSKIARIISKIVKTYYSLVQINICIFLFISLEIMVGMNYTSLSPLFFKLIFSLIIVLYITILFLEHNVVSILIS